MEKKNIYIYIFGTIEWGCFILGGQDDLAIFRRTWCVTPIFSAPKISHEHGEIPT